MVKIDLRKLSAPIKKLAPDVDAAYTRLDATWEEISKHIAKLKIPCTVGYPFDDDGRGHSSTSLEWRKWRGKKRFCITYWCCGQTEVGYEEHEDVTPYEEWSAEQRVDMLRYVEHLFENAPKQIQRFIDKTQDEEDDE